MNPTSPMARPSNVHYLAPSAPAHDPAPRLSRTLVLRLRVLSLWWRTRLTAVEVCGVVRRFGRPAVQPEDAVIEQSARAILTAAPRPLGPARVIDFEAARARLR